MQVADKLLEMTRGQKIMGNAFALIAVLAFVGVLQGHEHQIALSGFSAVVAVVLRSNKDFTR